MYMCVRSLWVDGRIGRKVNGREGGTPCLICSALLTSAQRMLHPPIPANQEAKPFLLQFVACAAHHKCFKRAALCPPLNIYACKPCFEKLERAGHLQHWWWLSNPHSNVYLFSIEKTTRSSAHLTGPSKLPNSAAVSLPTATLLLC